jgi:spore maturation protein CgeB
VDNLKTDAIPDTTLDVTPDVTPDPIISLISVSKRPGVNMTNINVGNLKVLYLPINGRIGGPQTATEKAFISCGFHLCSLDYLNCDSPNETFIDMVKLFKPDWIHMQLQFSTIINVETIKTISEMFPKTIITNWTGDIRSGVKKEFIDMSFYITKFLISSEGQLEMYKQNGCKNVGYWQVGVDTVKFRPLLPGVVEKLKKKYHHDVVFCANINPAFPGFELRVKTAEAISSKIGNKFQVYGSKNWQKKSVFYAGHIPHQKQNLVYNASRIIISINNFNDISMYFSARQLIAMASGRLVISAYVPGLERYFKNKYHLVWFNTPAECVELVEYYLNNPEEADLIGSQGQKEILKNHTFAVRIKELVNMVGLQKKETL